MVDAAEMGRRCGPMVIGRREGVSRGVFTNGGACSRGALTWCSVCPKRVFADFLTVKQHVFGVAEQPRNATKSDSLFGDTHRPLRRFAGFSAIWKPKTGDVTEPPEHECSASRRRAALLATCSAGSCFGAWAGPATTAGEHCSPAR